VTTSARRLDANPADSPALAVTAIPEASATTRIQAMARAFDAESPSGARSIPAEELLRELDAQQPPLSAEALLRQLDVEFQADQLSRRPPELFIFADVDAKLEAGARTYALQRGGSLVDIADARGQALASDQFVNLFAHGSRRGCISVAGVSCDLYANVIKGLDLRVPGINLMTCYGATCGPEMAAALGLPVRASIYPLKLRAGQLFEMRPDPANPQAVIEVPTSPDQWDVFLPPGWNP
jgi:hypothetical protein